MLVGLGAFFFLVICAGGYFVFARSSSNAPAAGANIADAGKTVQQDHKPPAKTNADDKSGKTGTEQTPALLPPTTEQEPAADRVEKPTEKKGVDKPSEKIAIEKPTEKKTAEKALDKKTASLLSVEQLKKAAENGDPEAQYRLGLRFEQGQDVIKDFPEAAEWFTRAVARDHPQAMLDLARLYAADRNPGIAATEGQINALLQKGPAVL